VTLLVATAVEAEAAAVRAGISTAAPIDVLAAGVGPAAAAAGVARAVALAEARGRPYRVVVCAGIAGGFAGRAAIGATVLSTASVAAGLGAESPDGFVSLDELGLGTATVTADAGLLAALRPVLPLAVLGVVLTVSTATGTAATAAQHAAMHPDAVAEAMEGYGVAVAATAAGLPFVELRTISNEIGPRDRAAWRIGEALAALTAAAQVLDTVALHTGQSRSD
jgi:futalosine hydrolase